MTVTRSDSGAATGPDPSTHEAPEVQPPQSAAPPKADHRLKALRMFATSITVFTVLGHLFLGFEQSPITPIAAILFGYALDLVLETLDARAEGREPGYAGGLGKMVDYLLPTHIAGLACALLLWGNASLWPYLFAVAVAVSSKYLFRLSVRGRKRHFLNPSNFGIAVTLLIFPWVGIAPPYHFTNNTFGTVDWLISLGILMAGTMLNVNLTKRWPLILAWVGGFALQAVLRWLFLDHMLLAALMPMTGVAFILFTNYMITDPGTTPSKPRNQMVFGFTTAMVYGLLVSFNIVFGLFFALVITCVLRGLVLVGAPFMPGAAATAPPTVTTPPDSGRTSASEETSTPNTREPRESHE
ncbi:enediyne biosynthesis protein UnbU [Nocardiopsis exhalans]|uniref:Enediyne biosynthesis protein UnbU n=1 Tax=Nocardiopsis exhalans TaxID=163604 RepID=A0ABY5D376_9ACTN|nr:enediyne biosynthesis protein UnbU [Nocardiopsis exhalans]USY17533.1 enediyne biosynthesis protein UnbU [Nocardiopsis exhalans]